MAKPIIKFKTYRQAAAVGGKIYGVPNLGDPVVAEVTMQEVIDYAKLHNYSADTLSALLSQVIAGVGELVARDGRPRMLSDLLKFEPVIKGTFNNMEQTVTNQKVLVRPRMLKEIKVNLNAGDYSWQNVNDTLSPKIISVAPNSSDYSEFSFASFFNSVAFDVPGNAAFGWTYAGTRLCPNGWDNSCSFKVLWLHGDAEYHLEKHSDENYGVFEHASGDDATDNAVVISPHNYGGLDNEKAWFVVSGQQRPEPVPTSVVPVAGDVVKFVFSRTVASGDIFTVEKSYTL